MEKKTGTKKALIIIVEIIICVFIAFILVGVVQQFVFTAVKVEKSSMLYTISDDGNSKAFVLRTAKKFERGDIIVFYHPHLNSSYEFDYDKEWTNPMEKGVSFTQFFQRLPIIGKTINVDDPDGNRSENCVIKRIIGTPGDAIIKSSDGKLYVRYAGTSETQYLNDLGYKPLVAEETVVMDGELYVLGDNRQGSIDSEDYGCIKQEWIFGKVVFLYTDGKLCGTDRVTEPKS